MRQIQTLAGMLTVAGLLLGTTGATGQEPASTPPAVAPATDTGKQTAPDANLAPDSRLPEIPMMLMMQISFITPKSDLEQLALTKQQQYDIRAYIAEYHAQRRILDAIRGDLDHQHLKTHRFHVALTGLLEEIDKKAQHDAQRLLTVEQRAKLRQLRRREVYQAHAPNAYLALPYLGLTPLGTLLANDDLLAALEQPEIQQRLQITDEQWLQIEEVKKAAYPAAHQLILKACKLLTMPPPEENQLVKERKERLAIESLDILTADQRARLEELQKERKKKLAAAIEQGDFAKQLKLALTHGMTTQVQIRDKDGVNVIKTGLHNLFAEPEVARELDLSEVQQRELARQISVCDLDVQRIIVDSQIAFSTKIAERQQFLRDLVLPHNREFQRQLEHLLTEDQKPILMKEHWRSLGMGALLRPEIAGQLRLTDKQKEDIAGTFKLPLPQMKFPVAGDNLEQFRKNSEEFQKKSREHHQAIVIRVWEQLTPEQVLQFEKMTGQVRPAPQPKEPSESKKSGDSKAPPVPPKDPKT